jgi:hypothetical protein
VLASAFLLQWTLMQIAVLMSLAFLIRLKETDRRAYLLAAILSGVIATYSSGNGMLLWPVVLIAGALLSLPRRRFIALCIAAVVSVGAYFIGYHFTGHLSIGQLFLHPLYLLEFVGSYLSMPFGGMKSPQFGARLGIASFAIVILLLVLSVRMRVLRSRPGVVFFGWYGFAILTALLIAAGRIDPADPYFTSAKTERYVTLPLVTWAVFILACLWISSRGRWKVAAPAAITFVVAVLLLVGFPKLRWWMQARDAAHANEQLGSLALEDGLDDQSLILNVFPDPPAVDLWSQELRSARLSIFYKGSSRWLGRPAQQYAPFATPVATGEITYTFPVASGIEIAGWMDESQLRDGKGRILFTNEKNQIVGFGRKLPAGFPPVLQNPRTPPSLGWVGFVNLKIPTKVFSTYAVNKRGLLLLQGPTPVPPESAVRAVDAGPAIPGVQWQMDPSWTENGVPPRVPFGPPPAGRFYSSWSGDDRNTGRITSSSFAVPRGACLILPLLNGPSAEGLSAEVLDADRNQVIAQAKFQGGTRQWSFWSMPISRSVKHIRVTAEDNGKNWGQWLAIGTPEECAK